MDPEIFSIVKKTLLTTKKFNEKFLTKFNIDKDLFYEKQNEIKLDYENKITDAFKLETGYNGLPVVEGGKVVGIITQTDILRLIEKLES